MLKDMFNTLNSEKYKEQVKKEMEHERTFAENNRQVRRQMLEQTGRIYRSQGSRCILQLWAIIMGPFFVIGIGEVIVTKGVKVDWLAMALLFSMYWLPFGIICSVLNLFLGRELAVFQKEGFWCMHEIESGYYLRDNKETLVYVPYSGICEISYISTQVGINTSSSTSNRKGCYSAVILVVKSKLGETDRVTSHTYVLRTSPRTLPAKLYAKYIAKHTNGLKVIKK
ncbi:MAG: hypothetical protein ACI4C5_09965 [Lachnospiraceae bacterium]